MTYPFGLNVKPKKYIGEMESSGKLTKLPDSKRKEGARQGE